MGKMKREVTLVRMVFSVRVGRDCHLLKEIAFLHAPDRTFCEYPCAKSLKVRRFSGRLLLCSCAKLVYDGQVHTLVKNSRRVQEFSNPANVRVE